MTSVASYQLESQALCIRDQVKQLDGIFGETTGVF